MNDNSNTSMNSYSILGLDVCTDICPNLRSFIRFLLSGEGENVSSNSTHCIEKGKKIDEQAILDQITSCIKNVFLDSQVNKELLRTTSFSINIHNPFPNNELDLQKIFRKNQAQAKIKETLGLDLNPISFLSGEFVNAFSNILSEFEKSNQRYLAFISPFTYQSSRDNVTHKLVGFASILLSKDIQECSSYAQILIPDQSISTSDWEESGQQNIEENCEGLSHFIFAPPIQIISAILEIHHKSFFSITQNVLVSKNSSPAKQTGTFIRPWFLHEFEADRHRELIFVNDAMLRIENSQNSNRPLENPFQTLNHFLLPLSFGSGEQAITAIDQVISSLEGCNNCLDVVTKAVIAFKVNEHLQYTLIALGNTSEELIAELDRARSGIIKSLDTGKDWQTPNGSYFTPNPLGPDSKIAFVYPGAFNTYVGMGSELFYLFPELYDSLLSITENPSRTINANVIFPKDISPENTTLLQNKLFENPIQMISSGVCFSYLYTKILRDCFGVEPSSAFGYSLGENSMMFAMGIWSQADAMRTSLEVSPIFHSRVSGKQLAISEYWNTSSQITEDDNSSLWANHVVMAPKEVVEQLLVEDSKVYITHVNTSRQVVIGGENNECQKILDSLKCMHLQAPYHHAIHCAPVASEYDGFLRLHDWPVENSDHNPRLFCRKLLSPRA